MLRASDTDRAVIELFRSPLRIIHEFSQRFDRQLRAHHDENGEVREQRDRIQIPLGIIAEIVVERPVGGHRTGRAHHQRVAVGRCLRPRVGADIAACPRPVIDDEGLPDGPRHPLEQDAHDHVARAAARKGNDDLDGSGRVGLRRCRPWRSKDSDCGRGHVQKARTCHGHCPRRASAAFKRN